MGPKSSCSPLRVSQSRTLGIVVGCACMQIQGLRVLNVKGIRGLHDAQLDFASHRLQLQKLRRPLPMWSRRMTSAKSRVDVCPTL